MRPLNLVRWAGNGPPGKRFGKVPDAPKTVPRKSQDVLAPSIGGITGVSKDDGRPRVSSTIYYGHKLVKLVKPFDRGHLNVLYYGHLWASAQPEGNMADPGFVGGSPVATRTLLALVGWIDQLRLCRRSRPVFLVYIQSGGRSEGGSAEFPQPMNFNTTTSYK